jgi:hypothetical protein
MLVVAMIVAMIAAMIAAMIMQQATSIFMEEIA